MGLALIMSCMGGRSQSQDMLIMTLQQDLKTAQKEISALQKLVEDQGKFMHAALDTEHFSQATGLRKTATGSIQGMEDSFVKQKTGAKLDKFVIKEQRSRAKIVFDAADKNKDGVLTLDEIKAYMATDEDVKDVLGDLSNFANDDRAKMSKESFADYYVSKCAEE